MSALSPKSTFSFSIYRNNTGTIRCLVDETIDPTTQCITYIEDCQISGNEETMSTHCVVHRLLKNLSFFYCCFSVKASTLNPRTSTFCSLLHLRTIVRRNSKLWQFCNYLNSMVLSHLIRLTRVTFLICTLMAFEVIFITIKLTV